jgi:hypothetical protein
MLYYRHRPKDCTVLSYVLLRIILSSCSFLSKVNRYPSPRKILYVALILFLYYLHHWSLLEFYVRIPHRHLFHFRFLVLKCLKILIVLLQPYLLCQPEIPTASARNIIWLKRIKREDTSQI